jgi:lipopolysaccharide/colanic/teichoic acid biosynthesis glycosyltransferase
MNDFSRLASAWLGTQERIYPLIKRLFDLVVSLVTFILLSPLLILISVVIKLDSPGPSLFRQTRIGKGGKPFTCYKFRTMVDNADQTIYEQFIKEVMHNEPNSDKDSKDVPFRMKIGWKDSRITRIGRFLRVTSIDELPQLFNVLKGEMSIVGPRPEVPLAVEGYTEYERRRLEVLPGITGLWQISGRSNLTVRQMFVLDVSYVDHRSLWLDLKIFLKTIPVVIARKGTG